VESDAPALALGQQEFLYLGPKMQPKVAHYAGSDENFVTSNPTSYNKTSYWIYWVSKQNCCQYVSNPPDAEKFWCDAKFAS